MPPALALAGAAVVGSVVQAVAGSKAAKAQVKGQEAGIAEQRRQYEQTRSDYAPWRTAGSGALDMLSRAYGIGGEAPDMSAFYASPGYNFRFNEGQRAIGRRFASRGLLNSGAADKARIGYGEGLASSEFGDWWNRLAGVAGLGQSGVAGTAAAGSNAANNITNAYGNIGNARASSYINTGSAINSGINNALSSYFGGFGGGNKSPSSTTYYPQGWPYAG